MAVRNCADLGINAQYIVKRLLANQNLLKLLYYTDKDPLSHEDLTEEQIEKRLARMNYELSHKDQYDYVIVNDDLETAIADLCKIIDGEM